MTTCAVCKLPWNDNNPTAAVGMWKQHVAHAWCAAQMEFQGYSQLLLFDGSLFDHYRML